MANSTRYRRLATWISDTAASEALNHMAADCEEQAAKLRLD